MLTHKDHRQTKRAQQKSNAGLLGLLYRDVMSLIVKRIKLRDILRLLQTCKYMHVNPVLRTVVGTVKPGMIKAIKARRKRNGKKCPLGKGQW